MQSRGIPFTMPADFKKRRLKDREFFYCPKGHAQHYTGESAEVRLKRELLQAQQKLDQARADATYQSAERRKAEIAAKGAWTRVRKLKARAAAGVCSCCNRYFPDLHAHMSVKHPAEMKGACVSPAVDRKPV